MFRPRTFVRGNEIIRKNRTFGTARYTTVRKYAVTGERKGPPTLWYLGNVDGPQCHANQVVPATGLVDDAMTPARKSGCILSQTSDPRFLSSVPESTVLWQSFSASATLKLEALSPAPGSLALRPDLGAIHHERSHLATDLPR